MATAAVLLHGFTHTGSSWAPVIEGLGPHYRAIAPDIRGHGHASQRRPVTLAAVLGDIERLVPPTFTLVGYSMGGRVALHAGLALGDRVERLVLVGASPGLEREEERRERRLADARLAEEIERSTIEDFSRRWAALPVHGGQPPAVALAAHADRLKSAPEGLAAALRGLGTAALPSLWDRLGELEMQVAIVVGERDQKFREIALRMATRLPAAEVTVVPGAGHAVHLEQPDFLARIIASRS